MTIAPSPDTRWYDPVVRAVFKQLAPAGAGARLSITIFHRVHAQADPLFPLEMDRQRFDQVCAWLAAWFTVLPLDEAVRRLGQGSLPARAMAISFDDGYADNCDIAMPILQAHGLTATFFVATGFLDGGRMWNDSVIETLRRCDREALDLSGLGLPGLAVLPLTDVGARHAAIGQVLRATKYLAPDLRLDTVRRIADLAGVARLPDDLMMCAAQVRALADGGMQIGAHTVSHPILSLLDDADARQEIARSQDDLAQILGQPVRMFAYPNGQPGKDFSARDAKLVRELGFELAVTTAPGAAQTGDDLFQLPRFVPWASDRMRWAMGLGHNLRRRAAQT